MTVTGRSLWAMHPFARQRNFFAMQGRVLTIAGSDPSGGAGIQADIKTITAFGAYASSAITALTVQNTLGVTAVHGVPAETVRDQIIAVLSDIGTDAVKIGMIGDVAIVDVIEDVIAGLDSAIPVVLDPVLVATSGDALAGEGVAGAILNKLVPRAALVTPNTDEATALTGIGIDSENDMIRAGRALLAAGAKAVLVKGGHRESDVVSDLLLTGDNEHWFRHPRIETTSTHGTGCTLAAGIAACLAQGTSLRGAVARSVRYVQTAIQTAPGFGAGAGPLNHAHVVSPLRR